MQLTNFQLTLGWHLLSVHLTKIICQVFVSFLTHITYSFQGVKEMVWEGEGVSWNPVETPARRSDLCTLTLRQAVGC